MLVRGNGLMQVSFVVLKPVIDLLAMESYRAVWELDVDGYCRHAPKARGQKLTPAATKMLELCAAITSALTMEFSKVGVSKTGSVTETLVSKILLGTTGAVPGLDAKVKSTTHSACLDETGLWKFFDFYKRVSEKTTVIEDCRGIAIRPSLGKAARIGHRYSQAKVLDMMCTMAPSDRRKNKIHKRKSIS